MACVLISAVFVLLAWANSMAARALQVHSAPAVWWVALAGLWLVGAGVGAWGGFFAEYQASPTLRVSGAPLPVGAAQWEGAPGHEQWVGYGTPAPLLLAGANVPLVGLLAGSPVGPAFWVWRRVGRTRRGTGAL